jgi:hypothetical protein
MEKMYNERLSMGFTYELYEIQHMMVSLLKDVDRCEL